MMLERQVLAFLELEVFAAEMYRQHPPNLPSALHPIMKQFAAIEDGHRDRFAHLYQTLTKKPAPGCINALRTARIVGRIAGFFGWRTLLHVECWIERRAVVDYERAMKWVKHPDTRRAIAETLAEEEAHQPYLETLKQFRDDETQHIQKMTEFLQKDSLHIGERKLRPSVGASGSSPSMEVTKFSRRSRGKRSKRSPRESRNN